MVDNLYTCVGLY